MNPYFRFGEIVVLERGTEGRPDALGVVTAPGTLGTVSPPFVRRLSVKIDAVPFALDGNTFVFRRRRRWLSQLIGRALKGEPTA